MAAAEVKQELHDLIDEMDTATAVRLLAMISLIDDPDDVDEEEAAAILKAREEFAAGYSVSGADLRRELGWRP
ncbi:MAG: hypothetical protein ABI577_14985 [bacterium]